MGGESVTGSSAFFLLLRCVLGAVLILAGGLKLQDPLAFRLAVEAFGLVPEWLAIAVAVTLPVFELLCGALLIAGIRLRAMSLAATVLMALFTLAMSWAAWRGIECGCFGSLRFLGETPELAIVRNVVLLAMAALLWYRSGR